MVEVEKKIVIRMMISLFFPRSFVYSVDCEIESNLMFSFSLICFPLGPTFFRKKKPNLILAAQCAQFKELKSGFGKRKRLFILFNVMPLRNFSIDNNAPT